jgi:cephalosporin-C deacetylase
MPRIDPSRYRAKVKRPDDFDAFWDRLLKTVAEVPLRPQVEHVPLRSTEHVDVFAAHFDSLDDVRIFGWYSVPRDRPGPFPALLYVPGYISDPPLQKAWSKLGYAVLSVAPRGKIGSYDRFNPGYPGLLTHNIVDRHTYGYRGFYVDAFRGVDFLLSRAEVNREAVGVFGSSQGGGLAIVVAALHRQVAAASAGVPYLCGILEASELTSTYPYYEIRDYLHQYPDQRHAVEETLAYYDGINFAPRITCPMIVNLGLQDNVCPPETGFAVFEKIGSRDKTLHPYDQCGHDGGRIKHDPLIESFFAKQLQEKKASTR